MITPLRQLCISLLLLLSMPVTAAEPERLRDLRLIPEQQVLLLLVSQPHCHFCEQIKTEVIGPMIKSGLYDTHTQIRQILINNNEALIDADGSSITATAFALLYDAWATPTLLFLDRHGHELAPKMVGINTPEYYGYYVDRTLEQARAQLLKPSTERNK